MKNIQIEERFYIEYKTPEKKRYTPQMVYKESFEDAKKWIDNWKSEQKRRGNIITTKYRIVHIRFIKEVVKTTRAYV